MLQPLLRFPGTTESQPFLSLLTFEFRYRRIVPFFRHWDRWLRSLRGWLHGGIDDGNPHFILKDGEENLLLQSGQSRAIRLQPAFPPEPGFLAFGILAGGGVDEFLAGGAVDSSV